MESTPIPYECHCINNLIDHAEIHMTLIGPKNSQSSYFIY